MQLEQLIRTIGIAPTAKVVSTGPSVLPAGLPPIVRAAIADSAELDIDGAKILLIKLAEGARTATTAQLAKDVAAASGCTTLVYFERLSKHMRSSLMRERVPFATEDGQFYIPGAISLLPMEDRKTPAPPKKLSPAAMRAFIWWLDQAGPAGTQDVASSIGLPRSTTARACDSLHNAGVISKRMVGKKNHTVSYELVDAAEAASKGSRAFGDPVSNTFYVDIEQTAGLLPCGESALASRSLLAPPAIPQFAASPSEGKTLKALSDEEAAFIHPAKIKVLAYDPHPQSDDGLVDPFTMLKTLDNSNDERVILSLNEALEAYPWYESQE